MASVNPEPNGRYRAQFTWQGKRHTLRLGKCCESAAAQFKISLEYLIETREQGVAVQPTTIAWLDGIGDKIRGKLAAIGLADPSAIDRTVVTLGGLIDAFTGRMDERIARGEAKVATERNARVVCENLVSFFGKNKSLVLITSDDIELFKTWLTNSARRTKEGEAVAPLKRTTVSRRCRRSREIFELAVEKGWIEKNPFANKLRGLKETNEESRVYVHAEHVQALIETTLDPELRLILALTRFGGCQPPSEIRNMRPGDFDTERLIVTVHKPKVDHHEGKGYRQFPLWPEIEPHYQALFDALPEGEEFLFPTYRNFSGNAITKRCRKVCQIAGVQPWIRFFVNMRASREQDLFDQGYSITDVAAWFGHSPEVALKHYTRSKQKNSATAAALAARSRPAEGITSLLKEPEKSDVKSDVPSRSETGPTRTP